MDGDSAEGAIATVEYFFKAFDHAYLTGDVSPLSDISLPNCQYCAGIIDKAAVIHSFAEIVEWQPSVLRDHEFYEADGRPIVSLTVEQSPSAAYDHDGNKVADAPGYTFEMHVALSRVGDSWKVFGVRWIEVEG